MFTHPATQANLQLLAERGARICWAGRRASGFGHGGAAGRMSEPLTILGAFANCLPNQVPCVAARWW